METTVLTTTDGIFYFILTVGIFFGFFFVGNILRKDLHKRLDMLNAELKRLDREEAQRKHRN